MTKLEKTVSAARRQLRSGNRIEAIKAVRAAYPDAGLKGAKDFVDWLEMQVLSISATAAGWCVKHWQPFNFDQPEGHYLVAHTDALNLTTALDGGMQPSLQPVKCKCGNSFCTDRWHRLARWLGEDPRKLEQATGVVEGDVGRAPGSRPHLRGGTGAFVGLVGCED